MARRGDPVGRLGLAVALSVGCILASAMAMVAMLAFGCMALYFYMITVTSPPLAALAVAGAALVCALILGLAVRFIPRPSLSAMLMPRELDLFGRFNEAVEMGKAMGEEGKRAFRQNMSGASAAAFAFGIAMAVSPRLRRAVFNILRR